MDVTYVLDVALKARTTDFHAAIGQLHATLYNLGFKTDMYMVCIPPEAYVAVSSNAYNEFPIARVLIGHNYEATKMLGLIGYLLQEMQTFIICAYKLSDSANHVLAEKLLGKHDVFTILKEVYTDTHKTLPRTSDS